MDRPSFMARLFQTGEIGWDQHRVLHLDDRSGPFSDEVLPLRVLGQFGAGLSAFVGVLIIPHMPHFVWLWGDAGPDADVTRVFLPHLHDVAERGGPTGGHTRIGAVHAKFVEPTLLGQRIDTVHRVQEADVLPRQEWPHVWNIFRGPAFILPEFGL